MNTVVAPGARLGRVLVALESRSAKHKGNIWSVVGNVGQREISIG